MTSEESVMRCRDRIELLLLGARDRAAYTHFVSIPMTHEVIKENFRKFVEAVMGDDELPVVKYLFSNVLLLCNILSIVELI